MNGITLGALIYFVIPRNSTLEVNASDGMGTLKNVYNGRFNVFEDKSLEPYYKYKCDLISAHNDTMVIEIAPFSCSECKYHITQSEPADGNWNCANLWSGRIETYQDNQPACEYFKER